ncbi:MAG: phage terminase large subunit, partial [Geminicoccaceae bacterium]|nr:phage terminase large subunit [Geminicoccaceae bacterium]
FRNAGKSTLVGIFCAWLLLRDPDLRVLVLAAEHELAQKMVRAVRRIIERHPLTRHLVPKRIEQWAGGQFTVNRKLAQRDPSLLARGIGGNLTGSRADIVICDDVEVPNTCATPAKRMELRERLHEIAYVLVPGGLQLYVGTPHSYYTIYAEQARAETGEDAPFLTGFKRLVIPIVDAAGRSRWPERFKPDDIEEIRRRTGPAKFESQMLLMPRAADQVRLDPAQLVPYAEPLERHHANGETRLRIAGRRLLSATAFWDPAYGAPGGGDSSVIAAVFVDDQGHYWLHGIRYLEHDPAEVGQVDEATQLCAQVARFAEALELPAVRVETNGLGRFLPALLRRELGRIGFGCTVIEHVSKANKDQRILDALDPVLAAGALHVHEDVVRSPFIQEMREWRPGRNARDDGLDAVSACLLEEPVRLPRFAAGRRPAWRGASTIVAGSGFDL